jgi:hypothetical protein
METNDTKSTEYKPRDYTLERWIVMLLCLLFALPFVAQAQELTSLDQNDRAALLIKTSKPGVYALSTAVKSRVALKNDTSVLRQDARTRLTLITCYPFDAVRPGTSLRWVVIAQKVA